jgi:hypothetical protein
MQWGEHKPWTDEGWDPEHEADDAQDDDEPVLRATPSTRVILHRPVTP